MISIWIFSIFLLEIAKGYHHENQQPPKILEHPVDTFAARHEPATLKCKASGKPEPIINWYKDGVLLRTAPLDARSHRVLLHDGNLFFLKVMQSRKDSDAGLYWCEASNALGKARSTNATLTVAVLRDEFRNEPETSQVAAGENIILECTPPKGTPDPTISWKKDGQTLTLNDRIKLVDSSNLAITNTKPSDDGKYQCVAKNYAGVRESRVAVLKVFVKPYMVRVPKDVVVLVGGSVEFECGVGGDPLPDVLWKRVAPGGTMPLGRVRVLEDRTLRLERVTLLDQGKYTCEADNFAGAVSASGLLTVHVQPSFTVRPSAQTIEQGQEVTFHCNVQGSPDPFIFWSFEGDRALVYPGSSSGNFEAFTSSEGHSTLILKNAQVHHSGTVIICSGVNAAGSVSTRTRLTVTSKEDRPPPVINRGPVNQTLPIHSVAYLTCEASGNPKPVISWYKEGIPVSGNDRINMTNPSHLEIHNLRKDDSGSYTCVASSKGGKATWTGNLLVENPKNPNINFFKAPEPIMLPGPPSRPHALNQSEGSVTITWAQNNKIGSSSLLGYQIELFGREETTTPTWTTVARRHLGPVYTQSLLTPGIPYTFLIRAENAHGLGPPSQLSEPIIVGPDTAQNWGNPEVTILSEARANLISTSIVKLTDTIATTPTTVKLIWDITDTLFVEGLYIYYVALDTSQDLPRTYFMLTVLHAGDSTSFVVNNLDKWSRYEFFIVPFYKSVEGLPSNSRTVRTLEDVPNEPPTNMEALLLNASAVYLKWKSPPPISLNGELQGFKVEVRTNSSDNPEAISVGATPNLLLTNLTSGVSYYVRVAASTRAGLGPFSPAATLRLDPASRTADNHNQRPVDADMQSGDFITETWFMALLISMVSVMVLLFGAMLFVRRRQMLSKKTMTPSRSNGRVLSTPLASKHEAPLWLDKETLPEYATTLPEYSKLNPHEYRDYINGSPQSNNMHSGSVNLHNNPMQHPNEYSRPNDLDYSSEKSFPMRKYKDFPGMQVQEYASPNLGSECNRNSQNAEYAEVDSNLIQQDNGGGCSPAPYATTTLVTGARKFGNSMNWSSSHSNDSSDESPYPSYNGGYYNRKVYSDSYSAPNETLRKNKKTRKNSQENPPDLVSPNHPVYARVGPPGMSWRNGAPPMSSFTPQPQNKHYSSTRSEGSNPL